MDFATIGGVLYRVPRIKPHFLVIERNIEWFRAKISCEVRLIVLNDTTERQSKTVY